MNDWSKPGPRPKRRVSILDLVPHLRQAWKNLDKREFTIKQQFGVQDKTWKSHLESIKEDKNAIEDAGRFILDVLRERGEIGNKANE